MFLTSLFYLLSYSGRDYLPVKWVVDMLPLSSTDPVTSHPPFKANEEDEGDKGYATTFSLAIRYVSVKLVSTV